MKIDKPLFFAFVALTVFGLIMMSSISVAGSFHLTGENDFYFWRHFMYVTLGVLVFLAALFTPLSLIKKFAPLLYVFSILLLAFVLFRGDSFGTSARSWIHIGGYSIQPVEIAKLCIIFMLSSYFANGKQDASSFYGGFIPFVFILAIPTLLIMLQPDFGSLFVVVLTAASIYLLAGANLKYFFFGGGIASIVGFVVAWVNPYISKRFAVFFNPDLDPLGVGFQVKQALIAVGSGGLFGRGFHSSVQKFDYLPEVQSDTIFAAIAEELGFFRIIIFIAIYLFIAFRGYRIAKNAQDVFSQLVASGITTWIVGQAFVNIAVNISLFPNTGITLPLISYGGTSLWATFVGFAVLLHISAEGRTQKNYGVYRW